MYPALGKIEKYFIYPIIVFAIAIRCIGIDFGLPFLYHPDECFIVNPVVNILSRGDLNPHTFIWPGSLIIYILAILFAAIIAAYYVYSLMCGHIYSLNDFKHIVAGNSTFFYDRNPILLTLLGRLMMVALAAATIYIVYLAAKRLFNRRVGILAAFALSLSPLYIRESRYIRPDIPAIFLIMLSMYFLLLFMKGNKRTRWLIFSSVCAGFSIAAKYTSAVIAAPILIWCFLGDRRGAARLSLSRYIINSLKIKTNLGLAAVCILAGFFVFSPFVIFDFHRAIKDISWICRGNGGTDVGNARMPGLSNYLWYLRESATVGMGGLFFSLFAAIGGCLLLLKKSKRRYIFFLFPVLFFLLIGCGKLKFDLWFIQVLPFEAILFAFGFYTVSKSYISAKRAALGKRFFSVIFAAGLIYASLSAITFDFREAFIVAGKDLRTIAREWIDDNLPAGSTIAYEADAPHLHVKPKKDFILVYTGIRVVCRPMAYYRRHSVDYVVITSYMRDLFLNQPEKFPLEFARYEELKKCAELIKVFERGKSHGPREIEVYKLKKKPF